MVPMLRHFFKAMGYGIAAVMVVSMMFISVLTVEVSAISVELIGALDKLEQIEGVLYEIKVYDRYEQSGGLIAQDVQKVQPELVTVDKNDQSGEERLRLNYNGVIGLLVEAVKELRDEIREIKESR